MTFFNLPTTYVSKVGINILTHSYWYVGKVKWKNQNVYPYDINNVCQFTFKLPSLILDEWKGLYFVSYQTTAVMIYCYLSWKNTNVSRYLYYVFPNIASNLRFKWGRASKLSGYVKRREVQKITMGIQNLRFHLSTILNKGSRKYQPHFDAALQRCLGVVLRDSVT